ncbi:histidinol-phosphate aminotransferase 1 [Marinobacterium nitratireducens]|uniref:Histidinol-phosphate aminotransferase n=1 Tax=Marinobacterium nitratireducens TaxID=518897 RepID=A0A918DS89_9GAMM|nr:histidinol-phosphate transaminase [Marinobacterium nitratireducens]GGO80818.1 histidinol-phosphate aminotransferase 1 [Marinobacterium nitratireducens]
MSKYWSDAIRELVPYVPGEQPKDQQFIKLNTNESPYPPSPKAVEALQGFDTDRLRLYPDPDASRLKQALADYYGVERNCVFVGNGSDEVLAHTFMAFFRQPQPLLMPEISYSFYDVYCNLYAVEPRHIPLREDFRIALEDYAQPNGGIIFANPNAPTGRAVSLQEIEQLLQRNTESLVVVDEAYVDFGAESAVALTSTYDNVLVVQTFSKSRSLAGLRIGFAIGHPDLIEGLERVKNSFNSYPLDMLAISAGVAAIEDDVYFRETRDRIVATREWTAGELAALGFRVLPSCTNFLFASHRYIEAAELMGYLRTRGLLVRHFSRPQIDNYLRISIGTDDEMRRLVETLEEHPEIVRL